MECLGEFLSLIMPAVGVFAVHFVQMRTLKRMESSFRSQIAEVRAETLSHLRAVRGLSQ
jgi:hypothetical protein